MSEIKVDALSTVSGSGNLTVSNNIAGTSATLSATLGVTGNTTVGGTLVNTGLITASAGVAIGGTGADNTLDDYEEGTFEPIFAAAAGTFTNIGYNGDTGGRYIKIGNLVYAQGCARINGTLDKSNRSGNETLVLGNLPFTNSTRNNGDNADSIPVVRVPVWGSGDVPDRGIMRNNENAFSLVKQANNATSHTIIVSDLPADAMMQFIVMYTTN